MSDRDLLMIPGPIELEPSVLAALGEKQRGHLDPTFMKRFSRVLKRLREVFKAPTGQPFVLAGSGTLAMELGVANLVEPGDAALVVNTGYFSDRMGLALTRHGASVTHVRAPPGAAPALDEVKKALASQKFKVLTVTHVDTSTGVLAPVQELAKLAREAGVLSVVDGVCSVGAEALEQDAWGVDVALTGSQKALGAPPGLAVLMAGPGALAAWRARTQPVRSLYLDFAEWLPVHEAYEAEKPSYFATPPVNLLSALDVSLGLILEEGMATRTARHVKMANAFRSAFKALGLRPLPVSEGLAAHTLSALYYPTGVDAALVKAVAAQGVTIAGGLHPDLKTKYFRVGHMGAVSANDVLATVSAVERALVASKAQVEPGAGVAAAERALA
jgi:alanine-glyoxylate transaminase / serine-glyoxylate transaminase / serine-pyruvate transaminase